MNKILICVVSIFLTASIAVRAETLCELPNPIANQIVRTFHILDPNSSVYLRAYLLENEKAVFLFNNGTSCKVIGRPSGYSKEELDQAQARLSADADAQAVTNASIIAVAAIAAMAIGPTTESAALNSLFFTKNLAISVPSWIMLSPSMFGYEIGFMMGMLFHPNSLALQKAVGLMVAGGVGGGTGYLVTLAKDAIGEDEEQMAQEADRLFQKFSASNSTDGVIPIAVQDVQTLLRALQAQLMNVSQL